MKQFAKYLKGVRFAIVIAPILMVFDALGSLVQPYFMAKIIDVGIANGDKWYIYNTGIIMGIFAAIAMASGFGCMYFSSKAASGFAANLRKDLLAKIQDFSFANINKFSTASLITRLTNDVEVLSGLLQMVLRMAIRAPMMFLGGLVMAILLNARLALIILALIPIMIGGIVFFLKKALPFFEKVQIRIDKVNTVIRENIIGVKVIKAFVREEQQEERFEEANEGLRKIAIESFNILVWMFPLITIVMNGAIVAALWFGASLAQKNQIEIGEISSFITYITMTLMSMIMVSMVFMNASRSEVSAKRILEVLNTKPDILNKENANKDARVTEGKVEYNVKAFEFADSKGEAILSNINFEVKPGELIGIIGSTGVGKSTLVNLMPRFYDVTDGYVKIDGIDVKDYDIQNLRDGIGMVLQENRLFSGTIKENIKWGKEDATDEEIIEACKVAQIHDFIESLPDKYDSIVEERGTNFSGGQKQRLCIARALIKKPKILILDDSVSALDGTTEKALSNALRNEFKGTTIFMITQRISSCKNADRIIVMSDGSIESIGTHEELLQSSQIYKEINDSQLEVIADA